MNDISENVFKGFGVYFKKYLFTVLKIINIKSMEKRKNIRLLCCRTIWVHPCPPC